MPVGKLGNGGAESRFIEASDGERLHYMTWAPVTGKAWAVVVFLHGIASHAGWFGETAADLRQQGVAVYALDRRGSGLSGGRRGHLSRFRRALDDVDELIEELRPEQEAAPVFVAASSWAAKLVVVYASSRPAALSGLMLLGPGLLPRVNLSPARRVAVAVGNIVAPTARIAIPLTPELYTTTPHHLEFIRSDPLRLLTATRGCASRSGSNGACRHVMPVGSSGYERGFCVPRYECAIRARRNVISETI